MLRFLNRVWEYSVSIQKPTMSQSAFFDYGIRGENNQLVSVNPFSHSPVYLRHFPLFSHLIFLPSQLCDVSLDAFSLSLFQVVTVRLMVLLRILVSFTLKSWLKSSQKTGRLKPAQKLEQGETAGLLDQMGGFEFCQAVRKELAEAC